MKEIKLTQGRVALIDDEDFGEVSKHRWHLHKCGANQEYEYAAHHFRDPVTLKFRRTTLHRFLLGKEHEMVDHINGDGLDNRRSNLRPATRGQNRANSKTNSNRTHSWRGVRKSNDTFVVYCGPEYLGSYADPLAGAIAYDCAARAKYGPFARLNFPYGAG